MSKKALLNALLLSPSVSHPISSDPRGQEAPSMPSRDHSLTLKSSTPMLGCLFILFQCRGDWPGWKRKKRLGPIWISELKVP
ncbi:hypothetical protein AVEN_71383-1 [Araneus ventricosus]|uniref:Uncharacterized protein n=1 Tax=Araneus ventricosus TaxID=182803 RepID=A0A4Y2BKQ3_ARAVE|nr:hypothetical protein AVEN_71383-1 [Araneus ventricosus]